MEVDEDEVARTPPHSGLHADSSAQRFRLTKRRIRQRFKKARTFSVKCATLRAKHELSLNRSQVVQASRSCPSPSAHRLVRTLRSQNAALAASLNERLMENTELSNLILALRDENMALSLAMTELRAARAEGVRLDPEAVEAEHLRRLTEYLEPVKGLMNRVLDHTVAMSGELTQAMGLVSAPGRRSRSVQNLIRKKTSSATPPFSVPKPSGPHHRAGSSGSNVAHVSPRVGGHAIHKPQIEIQRLDMDDINRLQAQQRSRGAAAETHDEEPDGDDYEDEPLEPSAHHNGPAHQPATEDRTSERDEDGEEMLEEVAARGTRPGLSRMSTIGESPEDRDDETPAVTPAHSALTTPRRRPRSVSLARRLSSSLGSIASPVVLLENVSELLDQYNLDPGDGDSEESETEEDDDDHRMQKKGLVLLMPRLVLEKVKLTEKRRDKAGKARAPPQTLHGGPKDRAPTNMIAGFSQTDEDFHSLSRVTTQRGSGFTKAEDNLPSLFPDPTLSESSLNLSDVDLVGPTDTEVNEERPNQHIEPQGEDPVGPAPMDSPRPSLGSTPETPQHCVPPQEVANSETPRTRESLVEFTERMCCMDPMEGPSWLFTDDNKLTPGRRSRDIMERKRRSSVSLRAQLGECSKKLNLEGSDEDEHMGGKSATSLRVSKKRKKAHPDRSKNHKRTVHWEPTLDPPFGDRAEAETECSEPPEKRPASVHEDSALKAAESVPKRKSGRNVRSKNYNEDALVEQNVKEAQAQRLREASTPASPTKMISPPSVPKAKQPTRSPTRGPVCSANSTPSVASEAGSVYSTPCAKEEEPAEATRPRRRAAAAASVSLKEPSLGKKLRQGDPQGESIYSDFVPQVKEKKGSSTGKASHKKH